MEKREESIADQTVMQFNRHDRGKNGTRANGTASISLVRVATPTCIRVLAGNGGEKKERACDRSIRVYE